MSKPEIRYSFSKIKNTSRCPAKNHFAVLARNGDIVEDPAYPLVFGSAGHEGLEMALKEDADPLTVANAYVKKELTDKFPEGVLDADKMADRQKGMEHCITQFKNHKLPSLKETIKDPDSCVEIALESPFRKGILKGIIDLIVPGNSLVDWKLGRFPSPGKPGSMSAYDLQQKDAQSAIYMWLMDKVKLDIPKVFNYVFLTGNPTKMKPSGEYYKSGPNKGDPKMEKDWSSGVQYTIPVKHDENTVAEAFNNFINPYAEIYEQGIIAKNPSIMECSGCQYRTACQVKDTRLPSRSDYMIKLSELEDDKGDDDDE